MAIRSRIRKNDPAGLRGRVLDAAAASFQANGYAGTSIHDLVRSAEVTAGALHHHFPSKRDLVLAVIAERVSPEVEGTWISPVEEAPTAAEGIVSVFERVADLLEAQGSVTGCPLGNLALELSLNDESLRSAISGEYRTWRTAIARAVERDRAPYAPDGHEVFAEVVVAMFTGAMSIAKAEQRTSALRSCARQLRRLTGLPTD